MIEEKLYYVTSDDKHFTIKEEAESWEKCLYENKLFETVISYFEFNKLSININPKHEISFLMRKYVTGQTDIFDLLKKDIDAAIEISKKINRHE